MIGEWIFSALTGNSTISGIVSNRIFPQEYPPNTTFPCIVWDEFSYSTNPAYDKILDGRSYSVTFHCIDRDFDTATNLANQVSYYLDGAEGSAGGFNCLQSYLEGGSTDEEYDINEKPYFSVNREFSIDLCSPSGI